MRLLRNQIQHERIKFGARDSKKPRRKNRLGERGDVVHPLQFKKRQPSSHRSEHEVTGGAEQTEMDRHRRDLFSSGFARARIVAAFHRYGLLEHRTRTSVALSLRRNPFSNFSFPSRNPQFRMLYFSYEIPSDASS